MHVPQDVHLQTCYIKQLLTRSSDTSLRAGNSESPLLPPISVNAKGKRKVLLLNVSTERRGGRGGEEEESLKATCEWQASLKGRIDSGSANSILEIKEKLC